VQPRDAVLEDYALVVSDGRIADLLPAAAAAERYRADEFVRRPEHVLIPGLINAHTHAAMSLFRGLADDMPLDEWLNGHIWPAEMHWVSSDFVRDGTELAVLEMIRAGITCFNDMYFFPDTVARVAIEYGMRAVVGMIALEAPTPWAQGPDEYLAKGIAVHDQFKGNPLVSTVFAPHAPYTVSDSTFGQIRTMANELGLPIHMHLHETEAEVSAAVETTGRRPLERLDELGLVNELLTAVHATQLTGDEIGRLRAGRASVVHCPESNLKLASGFCPVARLLAAGINVALGTDGAASNNDLDMIGEMRTAALLGKGIAGDAAAVSAHETLAMATINGARALGLGELTGSLEIGKVADITCIDLGRPATQPVYHPVAQLIYAASREQVSDSWVAGRTLLFDGRLVNDKTADVLERARAWQGRLAEQGKTS